VRHGLIGAATLALLAAALPARAQDNQDAMKENLAHKLEKPFFKKTKWITDYDEAKAAAKKNGKLIFAYFTRSYAN